MEALETTRREVRGRARTLCGAGGKRAVVEWVTHAHLNYCDCIGDKNFPGPHQVQLVAISLCIGPFTEGGGESS